jgi:hypothetical protein
MDNQLRPDFGHIPVPELDHLFELIAGINVQEREGNGTREERLLRQPKQHRRVLPNRIKQHWICAFGNYLAEDVNAFSLKLLQMASGWHGLPAG